MPLISKPEFISLVNHLKTTIQEEDVPSHYIGMGNPDSGLLFVGSEKAIDINRDQIIAHHELFLNLEHWYDIITHHNHLTNAYDQTLLERRGQLTHFNPYNPLFLESTRNRVLPLGGHTYKKMKRLINDCFPPSHFDLNPITSSFTENVFSKCFITELSSIPALNQNHALFHLGTFIDGPRYDFLRYDDFNFFKSFKTVLLYFGRNKNYIGTLGSNERLAILKIFDPKIEHHNINHVIIHGHDFIYYQRKNGVRIILSYHMVNYKYFTTSYRNALATLIL
jgi:hypothetical protein